MREAGMTYETVATFSQVTSLLMFVAMFAGWKMGFIKVTDKSRRIFGMAILGYMIFALANLAAAWIFGANSGWGFFGFGSGMSILVSVVAVGLASYSLAMDFDSIDAFKGVMSRRNVSNPDAYERANYIKILAGANTFEHQNFSCLANGF